MDHSTSIMRTEFCYPLPDPALLVMALIFSSWVFRPLALHCYKIVSGLFLIAVSAQLPTATCNANANCTIVNCQIVCTCKQGFTQNAQNQCVPADPCTSQPCKNGGTCQRSASDPEEYRYVCFRLTALCNDDIIISLLYKHISTTCENYQELFFHSSKLKLILVEDKISSILH